MQFINQRNIVRELDIILPEVKNGSNVNILFRAPSGYGKTTLAYICLGYLGVNNSMLYIPEDGKILSIKEDRRFHFIDEIHTLNSPEFLYSYMDSGEYTFFFASNESGVLKEPLINRCIQFIFAPYQEEDIVDIVSNSFSIKIPREFNQEIASRSRGNPRVAKILCKRLNFYFNSLKITTLEDLRNVLDNYMEIESGGLNRLDNIYLNYLGNVGKSSLMNIVGGTGIDKDTILREIEPFLLYKKIIRITSRGRELC